MKERYLGHNILHYGRKDARIVSKKQLNWSVHEVQKLYLFTQYSGNKIYSRIIYFQAQELENLSYWELSVKLLCDFLRKELGYLMMQP